MARLAMTEAGKRMVARALRRSLEPRPVRELVMVADSMKSTGIPSGVDRSSSVIEVWPRHSHNRVEDGARQCTCKRGRHGKVTISTTT